MLFCLFVRLSNLMGKKNPEVRVNNQSGRQEDVNTFVAAVQLLETLPELCEGGNTSSRLVVARSDALCNGTKPKATGVNLANLSER